MLVRNDQEKRGKGYALAHAFELLAPDVDAVVVVDADTVVSPNLLRAFEARIQAGALAVQADYAVRNPGVAWRTRLMAIAFGAFHVLRSLARERLRVSSGLRGNGMCFTTRVLAEVPHDAFSIVEDVEYGIRLGEAATGCTTRTRRTCTVRWSRRPRRRNRSVSAGSAGRAALARTRGLPLLPQAIARRDPILLDLAVDILLPPLSTLAVGIVLGVGLALGARDPLGQPISLRIWLVNLLASFCNVLRGWSLSGTGARGLVDLACAPFYVAWKLWMRLRQPARPREWVRTAREAQPGRIVP